MTPNEVDRALHRLQVLAAERSRLEAETDGVVAMLMSPDMDGMTEVTWQTIGDHLGVTRQSAHARYRCT
jgi:hypothetical protein